METLETTTPKKKVWRGKKRKASPRPQRYTATRTRPPRTNPAAAAAMKLQWTDPVWRAQMMEKRKAQGLKNVGGKSRLGVPDGMRKAEALPLVEAAKESAKETM